MKRPDAPRPEIIGPDDGPEKPFPLKMGGKVVSGFGRGSKELGIPTANIPVDTAPWISTAESGVYFGWSSILLPPSHPDLSSFDTSKPSTSLPNAPAIDLQCPVNPPEVKLKAGWRLYPMVMSIGYNPFYKNTVRSAEVHVLHSFEKDFYGCEMRALLMGFIRPEYDYDSLEGLVEDIKEDIAVSGRSLGRGNWGPKLDVGYLWDEE